MNRQIPPTAAKRLGLGAVYKGLAIAQTDDGPMLYAANFRHGTVDMFDQNFDQVKSFTDPNVPPDFAPFNVQVLGDKLFVTYAMQDDKKHDDVAGQGNGFVDEFDLEGHLLHRVASGGPLDSPWGLAIAPDKFWPLRRRSVGRQLRRRHHRCVRPEAHDKFRSADSMRTATDGHPRPMGADPRQWRVGRRSEQDLLHRAACRMKRMACSAA